MKRLVSTLINLVLIAFFTQVLAEPQEKMMLPETMKGFVLDYKTKTPISNAVVELKNANLGVGYYRVETNSNGFFEVKDYAKHVLYTLEVQAEGYVSYKTTLMPGTEEEKIFLHREAVLYGRILDSADKPLSSVKVKLKSDSYSPFSTRIVETDANGEYRFERLPSNRYSIEFQKEGYITETASIRRLKAAETFRLPMMLYRPAGLSGKLLVDGIKEEVPAANILVSLKGPMTHSSYSYQNGEFQIQDIKPGKYSLHINHRGFFPESQEGIEIKEGEQISSILKKLKPREPSVSVSARRYTFPPASPPVFNIRSLRLETVKIKVYTVPVKEFIQPPLDPNSVEPEKNGFNLIKEWEEPVRNFRPFDWRYQDLELPDSLAIGTYCIEVSGPQNAIDRKYFTVTSTGIILKRSPESLLVYAVDLITNKPIPNAEIISFEPLSQKEIEDFQKNASAPTKVNNTTSVPKPSNQDDLDFDVGMNDDVFQPDEFSDIHLEPLEKKKEDSEGIRLDTTIVIDQLSNMPGHVSLRGKTDENGLFLGKTNSKKQMMIFAIAPNDSFAIASTGVPYSYGAEMKKFFVYTDRPVYRSGDRVFFKVLGKERKYHFEPILEGNYSYEVKRSGSSEIVQKGDFSLDEWGSFAGEIQLEKGAKPSSYYISILESTNHIGEGRFYVEQYRKPEFKVSITPSQKFYTNKEKASFRVDARYFFGSPLKNTLIRYRFYESKLRDRQAVYWWEEDYSSSESYNRLKLEGEKYLDENGRAVIEIDCGDYPYDRELSLEVTVVDKSNVAISESQAVKVGRGEFYIRIRPESNFFSTASEKKINFIVSDFSEKPVKTRLHLRFYRFIWKSWQRVYVHSESPVYETKVETDEKGRFQLSLDKELKEPGEFDIVVSAVDKKDNVIKANYTLWLYDPLHNKIESRFKNLELSLEKESLDKAGEVTVLLKSKYSGFPVLISLEGKDIYETKLIYMKDNVVPVKLQVKDGYAPNFYIQAAMQKNRALFIARESFNLPVKDTELEIKFHSKKEDFRPGETVNMELEVKSKEGKGLKADVSVSVVDEAIYSIKEDFTPRMKDFFYTKISNYVITNYSFPLNLLAGAGKDGKKDEGTRKNFKDTAHWSAHIQTDESGKAKFDFSVPDNLTEWRLTARAHDKKGRVGENRSNILVTKEIIARIGKPRFFTENDELSIIGIVNNNSQKGLENIQTGMKANGALLAKDEKPFSLPPNGSTSTYYPLKVEADKPNILLEYNALAGEFKDGLELSVPIHKVGNEFRILQTGDTKNNSNLVIPLEDSKTTQFVPEELIIQLEPGIVQSMLSSLQYLSEYPYGCTEQTISKFLPALMLDKIYKQKTGKPLSFDKDLDKKIKTGIERLKTMQNYDGSWGFWYGDSGNEFLTGYAMFSLYTASQSGYDVDQYNIKRGLAAMARMLTNPQDMEEDARAYLSFVSSLYGGADRNSIDKLIRDENSNAYRKAYLLRTLLNLQKHMKNENDKQEFKPYADKIPLILDSLKKLSEKDDKGTYFRSAEESTWSWQGGRAEVSAQVLLALLEAGDNSSLIPEILSSLQKRKEGNRWLSTRATSMVLYALSAYLEKNGIPELKEDKVEFFLNNKKIASFDLHPKETVGLKTVIPLSEFKDKQILLRANSQNQLNSFFSIEIKGNLYFKKEEEKKELEKGLSLERKLYTVKRVLDINRQEYLVPELFDTKKPLKTGDELMLKLRFKADRNYEFLALEAFLPSGFEVVKEDAYESSGVYSHKEKWDDKMVYFFSKVTKDEIYEVAYIIRAELPGKIQMKAAHIECMYSPDIRAWSDLKQLIIQEK